MKSITIREVLLLSKTGNVIRVFESTKDAAEFYKTTISKLRPKIAENKVVWKDGAYLAFGQRKKVVIDYDNYKKPLCKKCGEDNPKNFPRGRKSLCKKCSSEENLIRYRSLDDTSFTAKMQTQKEWRQKNIIHYRVESAKARAKRKKISFELTDEIIQKKFIEQNGLCYISKQQLTLVEDDWYGLSLDRLDNNIGYTVDNTILVTKFVNLTKNKLTFNEYRKYIKEIASKI